MKARHCWISLLVILPLLAGCATPHPSQPLARGSTYLLHLPGVAGETPVDHWWLDALHQGGIADQLDVYDWTCDDRGLGALRAYDRNHREAQRIADQIDARLHADPVGHVILTAVSGGTGIAVWALERLPNDVAVDNVILVAPAFSPDYDLTRALRHVRGKMYAFTSAGDIVMLGAGTRIFGTIDRKKTAAAGLVGLHPPPQADAVQYAKLVEKRYTLAWLRFGNFGDHTGPMSVCFARDYLAPMLAGRPMPE
jgi:pimeloyl-ACP methyl ester carboxylesterase